MNPTFQSHSVTHDRACSKGGFEGTESSCINQSWETTLMRWVDEWDAEWVDGSGDEWDAEWVDESDGEWVDGSGERAIGIPR